MTTVYVVGSTNDELIKGLCDPDPSERAKSAETIGLFHVYQALPFLLDTARTAPDEGVRATAQQAVVALMPSEDAAQRAIAGEAPFSMAEVRTLQKEQTAGVIALFKDHVAARLACRVGPEEPRQQGPEERDLLAPVIDYVGAWGCESATDLDEVGLAAAMAVGAICRFLEIEPGAAGPKFKSFNDANSRVAEYDAARDRCF